jgi:hypothetical protein
VKEVVIALKLVLLKWFYVINVRQDIIVMKVFVFHVQVVLQIVKDVLMKLLREELKKYIPALNVLMKNMVYQLMEYVVIALYQTIV